eukprot:1972536-Amphidinium_carterae.1
MRLVFTCFLQHDHLVASRFALWGGAAWTDDLRLSTCSLTIRGAIREQWRATEAVSLSLTAFASRLHTFARLLLTLPRKWRSSRRPGHMAKVTPLDMVPPSDSSEIGGSVRLTTSAR